MATSKTKTATELALILFYVPCPDRQSAKTIAEVLLNEKRIACANILTGGMESMYWWQGQIEQSQEHILLLKTLNLEDNQKAITERIEELHPYDTPCIMILPVLGINESYKNWLEESLR